MGKYLALEREITTVINKLSIENTSNTPDFILARIAIEAIETFERGSLAREKWYGKSLRIGESK